MMNASRPSIDYTALSASIRRGDAYALARGISLIETGTGEDEALLEFPASHPAFIAGITGPPGSGKSTLVDGLLGEWVSEGKKLAVLAIDPASPFHSGALLGDRIRMREWYNHPDIFIRSLSTRGSPGGLAPKIIEIIELIKIAGFDGIIIETVGVGQSEVEIAGIADTTVAVLVPEGGDDIQAMKAGLMEIADIFVVNKSDRPGANQFVAYLESLADSRPTKPEIIQTVATEKKGLHELAGAIIRHQQNRNASLRISLLAEKAYQLIAQQRMKDVDKKDLLRELGRQIHEPGFNLYRFVRTHYLR